MGMNHICALTVTGFIPSFDSLRRQCTILNYILATFSSRRGNNLRPLWLWDLFYLKAESSRGFRPNVKGWVENKITQLCPFLMLWLSNDMFVPIVHSSLHIPRVAKTSVDSTLLSNRFARFCNCSLTNMVGGCPCLRQVVSFRI